MIYDTDFFNTNLSPDYVDTEGSLTSPVQDFSGVNSVIVNWESYFRYCCYSLSPLYLEIGTVDDDVTSWTTFDAHGTFIESANEGSPNPLQVGVDVSCVAANHDSVYVRFAYRQAPEIGNGYSHYFWAIDDVVISSNDVQNDLEIAQITNGDIYNVWEYRVTPMEQAITEEDGGMLAGVLYRNVGVNDQLDVEFVIEVLDADGMVLDSTTAVLDTAFTFASAPVCPANAQDTAYIATGWVPEQPGTYTLRVSLNYDSLDATPGNNVMEKLIVYTEDQYGHDDEMALDGELGPREDEDIPGFYNPTGYGSYFHCPNIGSEATGVAVRFGPDCGLNADGAQALLEFETRLYIYDGAVGLTASPYEAAYWIYNNNWSNTTSDDIEIFLAFDEAIPLDTAQAYFVCVVDEYGSDAQLTVLAQLDSDTDNSTGLYELAGSGDFVWFSSQTPTPAVRLVTSTFTSGCLDSEACNYDAAADVSDYSCLFVGEPCNDFNSGTFADVVTEDCICQGTESVDEFERRYGVLLHQNIPNPVSSTSLIRFEVGQSRTVSIEVRDLMGKLIEQHDLGVLPAGQHQLELDVAKWAAGTYSYTLSADGLRTTKKMTVQ